MRGGSAAAMCVSGGMRGRHAGRGHGTAGRRVAVPVDGRVVRLRGPGGGSASCSQACFRLGLLAVLFSTRRAVRRRHRVGAVVIF
jgi:hypothetical protein